MILIFGSEKERTNIEILRVIGWRRSGRPLVRIEKRKGCLDSDVIVIFGGGCWSSGLCTGAGSWWIGGGSFPFTFPTRKLRFLLVLSLLRLGRLTEVHYVFVVWWWQIGFGWIMTTRFIHKVQIASKSKHVSGLDCSEWIGRIFSSQQLRGAS